jgi:hypothetical protein
MDPWRHYPAGLCDCHVKQKKIICRQADKTDLRKEDAVPKI